MAKKYKNLKPKYIELYSRKPPSIAPSRLADNAPPIVTDLASSDENTNPENRIGSVRTPVTIMPFMK